MDEAGAVDSGERHNRKRHSSMGEARSEGGMGMRSSDEGSNG
jgi:hypothetical protein